MKTLTVYSFNELSKEAQETAIENYREKNYDQEVFWANEMVDSLTGLFKACDGIKMTDYSLGNQRSSIDVEFSQEEAGELSGPRAMAWIENNLLYKLRYKAGISYIKERVWRSDIIKSLDRKDGAFINSIGAIKDCPFTGYCFDDDLLDSLRKDIKEGCTLKTTFEGLASVYEKQYNAEAVYQNSDEYIKETLESNNYDFTLEGQRI